MIQNMDVIDHTIEIIQNVYSTSDNEVRKNYEKNLKELGKL